jgi:hypothetical protein
MTKSMQAAKESEVRIAKIEINKIQTSKLNRLTLGDVRVRMGAKDDLPDKVTSS